jgi:hypothetical protein
MSEVRRKGGDSSDQLSVLGQYEVQFSLFKGKSFQWLAENGLGYAEWLVDNMRTETATTAPLSKNKYSFKNYLNSFFRWPECCAVEDERKDEEINICTKS